MLKCLKMRTCSLLVVAIYLLFPSFSSMESHCFVELLIFIFALSPFQYLCNQLSVVDFSIWSTECGFIFPAELWSGLYTVVIFTLVLLTLEKAQSQTLESKHSNKPNHLFWGVGFILRTHCFANLHSLTWRFLHFKFTHLRAYSFKADTSHRLSPLEINSWP